MRDIKLLNFLFYHIMLLDEDFKSENSLLLKLLDSLLRHLEDRGIHEIVRGGDRGAFYEKYLGEKAPSRLVIRLKARNSIHRDRRRDCYDLATVVRPRYEKVLSVYEEGKERKRTVQYNALWVKLRRYDHRLFLVVVKGFGMKPMMLLASCVV